MPSIQSKSSTHHHVPTSFGKISVQESPAPGMPIVFVHGSGSSSQVFSRQFESALAGTYHLIAIDLPGHGASEDAPDPATAYTLRGYAQAVREVLDALKIERTVMFGWSLGGHVAMELLSTTSLLAGLMITGAPPVSLGPIGILRGFRTHLDLLLASKENFSPQDAVKFEELCFGANSTPAFAQNIARADGRVRRYFFKSMMQGDGADELRAVTQTEVPVAVVNGENEPFARLRYVEKLDYGNLWDGQCHTIPKAGHAPFWDRPDIFNILLERFAHATARSEAGIPRHETQPMRRAS